MQKPPRSSLIALLGFCLEKFPVQVGNFGGGGGGGCYKKTERYQITKL